LRENQRLLLAGGDLFTQLAQPDKLALSAGSKAPSPSQCEG
jgi:hypothetical protein